MKSLHHDTISGWLFATSVGMLVVTLAYAIYSTFIHAD